MPSFRVILLLTFASFDANDTDNERQVRYNTANRSLTISSGDSQRRSQVAIGSRHERPTRQEGRVQRLTDCPSLLSLALMTYFARRHDSSLTATLPPFDAGDAAFRISRPACASISVTSKLLGCKVARATFPVKEVAGLLQPMTLVVSSSPCTTLLPTTILSSRNPKKSTHHQEINLARQHCRKPSLFLQPKEACIGACRFPNCHRNVKR